MANFEIDEKLIDFVKSNPCLHDKSNPDYKNKIVRESKWRELAAESGQTEMTLKKRWTALRTQFMAYLRRLNKPSGSAGGQRPFFRYEMSMRFLKDASDLQDEIISNMEDDSPDTGNETEHDSQVSDGEPIEEDEVLQSQINTTENQGSQGTPVVPRSKETPGGRSHSKFGTRKRPMTSFEQEALKKIDKVANDDGNTSSDDEFDLYTKALAPKFRKMSGQSPREFLKLQNDINVLINQSELRLLED